MDYIRLGQTRLEKSRMYLAGTTYRNLEKDAHVLMSSDRKFGCRYSAHSNTKSRPRC